MESMTEREHLELFLYRVRIMRELQDRYFIRRERQVLAQAKEAEKRVDTAIRVLTKELGYDMKDVDKKVTQKKLF